jgi:hypothetical protein
MVFSLWCGQQQIKHNKKCMQIDDDFEDHVESSGTMQGASPNEAQPARASLEADGCRHRASACIALPWRPPWSTISVKNTKH